MALLVTVGLIHHLRTYLYVRNLRQCILCLQIMQRTTKHWCTQLSKRSRRTSVVTRARKSWRPLICNAFIALWRLPILSHSLLTFSASSGDGIIRFTSAGKSSLRIYGFTFGFRKYDLDSQFTVSYRCVNEPGELPRLTNNVPEEFHCYGVIFTRTGLSSVSLAVI